MGIGELDRARGAMQAARAVAFQLRAMRSSARSIHRAGHCSYNSGHGRDRSAGHPSVDCTNDPVETIPNLRALRNSSYVCHSWIPPQQDLTVYSVPALTIPGLLSLRPVFNATPPDPSWHALMPAIWLQLVLSTSIVCNCIPPLRRVLADLQTGMMAGTVTEFFEYSVSGGRSNITGDRSGSRSGSQIGPKKSRSRRSKSRNIFQGSSAVHSMDRRESQRNLREDVILQTIDYEVHYDGIRRTRTSPSCEEESFRSDV